MIRCLTPVLLFLLACGGEGPPSLEVERGLFQVRLHEAATVSAVNSTTVSAPRLRTQLQVQWLIEEGTQVEKGDTLLIFDRTELQKDIDDRLNELEIAQASYNKNSARLEAELRSLRSNLVADSTSYLLSQLRRERTKYESEIVRQEAELQFAQATLSYEKSRANYEAQVGINREELRELELKIENARENLAKSRREYDQLVLIAPDRGMVVFLQVWLGGEPRKVKVGDTPWRGASLIELPDFNRMMVKMEINEVDLNLVSLEDSVDVVLDAWPDRHFPGRVTDIGVLARESENGGAARVFDLTAELVDRDPVLKPGMNARATLFGRRIEDCISLPVEAVHRDEDQWYVWLLEGSAFERVDVEVGPTDGDRIVIEMGLQEGRNLSLVSREEWAGREGS